MINSSKKVKVKKKEKVGKVASYKTYSQQKAMQDRMAYLRSLRNMDTAQKRNYGVSVDEYHNKYVEGLKNKIKRISEAQKINKQEKQIKQASKSPRRVYAEAAAKKVYEKADKIEKKLTAKAEHYVSKKWTKQRLKVRKFKYSGVGVIPNRPIQRGSPSKIVYQPLIKNEGGRPRKNINSAGSSILSQTYVFGGNR